MIEEKPYQCFICENEFENKIEEYTFYGLYTLVVGCCSSCKAETEEKTKDKIRQKRISKIVKRANIREEFL
jgi:hypothetical protein